MEEEKLVLEKSWDKVFPKSDKVNHKKVTFHNRYGITLAADRAIWCGQGTIVRAICSSVSRKRIFNDSL